MGLCYNGNSDGAIQFVFRMLLFSGQLDGRRTSGTFGGYWYPSIILIIPTSYGVAKSFG